MKLAVAAVAMLLSRAVPIDAPIWHLRAGHRLSSRSRTKCRACGRRTGCRVRRVPSFEGGEGLVIGGLLGLGRRFLSTVIKIHIL
jgi:hypothetical protein